MLKGNTLTILKAAHTHTHNASGQSSQFSSGDVHQHQGIVEIGSHVIYAHLKYIYSSTMSTSSIYSLFNKTMKM